MSKGKKKAAVAAIASTPDKETTAIPSASSLGTPVSSSRRWVDVVKTPSATKSLKSNVLQSGSESNDLTERMLGTGAGTRSRSDSDRSDQSFQSLQTVVGDVGFNTRVLLTIDPEKRGDLVSLSFTSLRPKTVFGDKQGDHVISHRLVLEFCSKVALNSRLVEIPEKIKTAFESLIPNIRRLGTEKSCSYPVVPDSMTYPRCDEGMSKILEDLGSNHREAYEIGMRQKRVNMVVGYLSNMLTYYNTMSDVTHAKSEDGGINQGKEHSSIVALKAISHFLSLDNPATLDQKTEFYKQAVEKNGEFVDGMIRIFDKKIVEVRKDFREAGKEDRFFEAFSQIANDPKIVGRVIEGLFDFPKTKGRRENKLSEMSKRCIEMSLVAFPELQTLDKRGIAEGFLEKVSANQNWSLEHKKILGIAQKMLPDISRAEAAQRI